MNGKKDANPEVIFGDSPSSLTELEKHRLLLAKVGNNPFVRVQELTIDFKEAQEYLCRFTMMHKILKWKDIKISVFI